MDIVSHGLWGAIAFGRKDKKSFWLAFFFGIVPDLFSFGLFFLSTFLGIEPRPHFSSEPPDANLIPAYVSRLYNVTHSLIVFAVFFFAVWLIRRKPVWELSSWGLHILFDIPTHSYRFFPTPFLWPVSSVRLNGISWTRPEIFFPNLILLGVIYAWFFLVKKRRRQGGAELLEK